MSRVGKQPIPIPTGVTITVDNDMVTVKGPKGELSQRLIDGVNIKQTDDQIEVTRINDEAKNRASHGLYRTLISNMVVGVTQGFEKKLEVNGVGFRVNVAGNVLKLSVGYSHEVNYQIPESVSITADGNLITVSGIDKQQVGQAAAEIRSVRKPEPYKGKGIKYVDERIRRKAGKSGKEGA